MNLDTLFERFAGSTQARQILAAIEKKNDARLLLTGLVGAQHSLTIASTYKSLGKTHLVIASDRDEAAYLQNDIAGLLEKLDVLYFPDSFRRTGRFEEIARNNVLQRTEAVNQLMHARTRGSILVTYPEALFEKVVAPQHLAKSAMEIISKNKLDVDFLVEFLIEYGFERTDFVYEPGQFAIRGGIVDIYSYGNELPYRVELNDDEVESIRTFNPGTQISERNIARVSIIPNINTKFDATQKASLLQLLPEGSVIWVGDVQDLLDRLQDCFEKAGDYANKLENMIEEDRVEEAGFLEERAFLLPRDVMTDMNRFALIETGKKSFFRGGQVIEFHSRPQPSFNKKFDMLIADLTSNHEKGYDNYVFADNPKQIQRFYSIFEDLKATMPWHPIPKAVHAGFLDDDLKIVCYTDHQIFDRFYKYKTKQGFEKDGALTLRRLRELQPGDYVTHIDHGVGRYSGLEKISLHGQTQEAVRIIYRDNDVLYVSINSLHKISKFVGKDGDEPKIHKLGTDAWQTTKRKAKAKIKELAFDLIQLYAKRKAAKGFAFPPDNYLQNELEASFIYEDTPDQAKASEDVKRDMEKDYPMDRLVCGDVGFGKTEVAIRAAFKAVSEGKQVAVLVPTTILALQHHKTFTERLKEFGVKVAYLNRFCTAKERTEIFKKTETGEIEILIGTHALLNQKVKFKDLGLFIIDEEQKFGVNSKEKIRTMKVNVDTLTLTATPIPRTLQFSLMAARDLSVMNTPPPNRQPIYTEVRTFNDELVKESIYFEIGRGGQVFFLHNRVQQLPEMAAMLKKMCPDVDIAIAHGQMESDSLEEVLLEFIDGQHDVLVCTNIIETGLDIPNANTIIINQAQNFGLSDLHQLRGRVGRSNRKAYCYLFCPPLSTLTSEARKRLQVIEEFSDLGSGFNIAMRDLDIRGAGNLLGAEQSGYIFDIGYEAYQKILEEAIRELKDNEYRDLFRDEREEKDDFVREVAVETDVEMLIPDAYVSNVQERLSLYTELDNLENEEALVQYAARLVDRFGKLPKQVQELFEGLRLRWVSRKLGIERVILKNQKLRCYFISNAQSPFYESAKFHELMAYISRKSDHRFNLKQSEKALILAIDGVKTLAAAKKALDEL